MTNKLVQSLVVSYLVLHIISALAYVLVAVTGISAQAVGPLLVFVLLPLLALGTIVAFTGFKSVRRIRFT